MSTKPLFILISDGGDGSYSLRYTLDREQINRQQALYDADQLESGECGVDGDGFHYDIIEVPTDATYESLGISQWSVFTASGEIDEDESEETD